MSQGIQNFYDAIQRKGLHRDFQFRIAQIGDVILDDSELILLKTSNLPGKEVANHEVPYMGVKFNLPGCAFYPGSSDWGVEFWMSQDFSLRDKFERAIDSIFDDKREGSMGVGGAGNMGMPGVDKVIELDLIGDDLSVLRTYFLIGCYVKKIEETPYSLGGTGEPTTIKASLAYQYWAKMPGKGTRRGLLGTVLGGIQFGRDAQEAIRGIGGIVGGIGGP